MARKRITKKSVDALTCPPDQDRVFMWDTDLKGFGVAAMPARKGKDGKELPPTKSYVVQYRQGGRSRRMTLGEHGRLTPDEARDHAKECRRRRKGQRPNRGAPCEAGRPHL